MGSSCACGVQSVGDAVSAGGAVSTGLVPLVLLMMLASGVDPGSAGVFCWGCLLLPNFADDGSFCF